MKTKYYLKLEIRYKYRKYLDLDEEDYELEHPSNIIHSKLYDTEKECIDLGNELISRNKWIEQYPGYKNLNLNRKFGYPLVAPSLKNGSQIFISILPLKTSSLDELETELQKFNIDKITSKL